MYKLNSYYNYLLTLSKRTLSIPVLSLISFIESFFIMIPPDIMLTAMVLERPNMKYYLSLITLFFSILGGIVGYLIGFYIISIAEPWIIYMGYFNTYSHVLTLFDNHGWIIILISHQNLKQQTFFLYLFL